MLTELFFALVSVLTLLRFDLSPEFVLKYGAGLLSVLSFPGGSGDFRDSQRMPSDPCNCLVRGDSFYGNERNGRLYHVASGVGYGAVMLALVLLFVKFLEKRPWEAAI